MLSKHFGWYMRYSPFPRLYRYLEKCVLVYTGNSIAGKAIDSFMVIANPSLPQATYRLPKTTDSRF
jgi:hypothetical protein